MVEPARAGGGFEDLVHSVPKPSDTIAQHVEFTKRVLEHLPPEFETSQRVAPKYRGSRKRPRQETDGGADAPLLLDLMKKTLLSNSEKLGGSPQEIEGRVPARTLRSFLQVQLEIMTEKARAEQQPKAMAAEQPEASQERTPSREEFVCRRFRESIDKMERALSSLPLTTTEVQKREPKGPPRLPPELLGKFSGAEGATDEFCAQYFRAKALLAELGKKASDELRSAVEYADRNFGGHKLVLENMRIIKEREDADRQSEESSRAAASSRVGHMSTMKDISLQADPSVQAQINASNEIAEAQRSLAEKQLEETQRTMRGARRASALQVGIVAVQGVINISSNIGDQSGAMVANLAGVNGAAGAAIGAKLGAGLGMVAVKKGLPIGAHVALASEVTSWGTDEWVGGTVSYIFGIGVARAVAGTALGVFGPWTIPPTVALFGARPMGIGMRRAWRWLQSSSRGTEVSKKPKGQKLGSEGVPLRWQNLLDFAKEVNQGKSPAPSQEEEEPSPKRPRI